MITDEKIKNSSELEFAVFCIENVAAKLGVDAEKMMVLLQLMLRHWLECLIVDEQRLLKSELNQALEYMLAGGHYTMFLKFKII